MSESFSDVFLCVCVCVCVSACTTACSQMDMHLLEGQCLATEVGGCIGVEDGAARLGGVVAQGNVSPAAQDVALGARTPLWYDGKTSYIKAGSML